MSTLTFSDPQGRAMKTIKEEVNNIPASCLPEQQKTSIYPDGSGKITLITHWITPYNNAIEQELLRKEYIPPFRTLPGFHTSQGIITPPTDPIGGYVLEGSQWILYGTPNQDRHY